MAPLHPAPLLPAFASYARRASLHPVLGWTAVPRTCRECAPLAPLPGTLPFHLRLPSSCHSSSGLIQVVALDPYSCLGSHTLGVPPQRVSEAFWLPFKWPESGFVSFVDFSHHHIWNFWDFSWPAGAAFQSFCGSKPGQRDIFRWWGPCITGVAPAGLAPSPGAVLLRLSQMKQGYVTGFGLWNMVEEMCTSSREKI